MACRCQSQVRTTVEEELRAEACLCEVAEMHDDGMSGASWVKGAKMRQQC